MPSQILIVVSELHRLVDHLFTADGIKIKVDPVFFPGFEFAQKHLSAAFAQRPLLKICGIIFPALGKGIAPDTDIAVMAAGTKPAAVQQNVS